MSLRSSCSRAGVWVEWQKARKSIEYNLCAGGLTSVSMRCTKKSATSIKMSCSNDNDAGKRDADAVEGASAEMEVKIQGAGDGDSNDSSDGHAFPRFFYHCLVRKYVGLDVKSRRTVDSWHYISADVWAFLQFRVLCAAHCRARCAEHAVEEIYCWQWRVLNLASTTRDKLGHNHQVLPTRGTMLGGVIVGDRVRMGNNGVNFVFYSSQVGQNSVKH